MQLHHVSLFVRDAERSMRFYRDGLGLEIRVDREFDGDWPGLFGVESKRLRAVILGDADRPHQVELVAFAEPVPVGARAAEPTTGTAILTFIVDLEATLPALLAAGATDLRRAHLSSGSGAATVRDPDGIMVQLLDRGSRSGKRQ